MNFKKIKFFIPVLILVVLFITLSFFVINTKYKKAKEFSILYSEILLTNKISLLVHEVQIERGMTIGYIATSGKKFKNELLAQRVRSDKEYEILKKFAKKNVFYKNVRKSLSDALKLYTTIQAIRDGVDRFVVDSESVLEIYSKNNETFLNVLIEISKTSNVSVITQNIIAYTNFLFYVENIGRERAIGTDIVSLKKLNQKKVIKYSYVLAKEKLFKSFFLKYADEKLIKDFMLYKHKKHFTKLSSYRYAMINNKVDDIHKINIHAWFKVITDKINSLKNFNDHISEYIRNEITLILHKTKNTLYLAIFLNGIGIIVFIFIIFLLLYFIYNENRLRKIIDKYVITSTTDTNGIIISASEAFCQISEYTKDELIGRAHNILRHSDMPDEIYGDMWKTLHKNKEWYGIIKNKKKNGGFYWVKVVVSPVFNIFNKKVGYSSVRIDITDAKKYEELNKTLENRIKKEIKQSRDKDKQLLQQSRLAQMGEMISMIAHQWRQPLAAISSTSSTIFLKAKLNKLDSSTAMELSQNINDFSKHLSNTIEDFRNFFKADKKRESIDFNTIIKAALDIVQSSLDDKKIKVITELKSHDLFVSYANELKQVILNLIKNAEDILVEKEIKDPKITINTYEKEDVCILEVLDNAGGIPKEIMPRIFDPYFSTKTKKDGTGLGLYMSKIIVEDHCKGVLEVENHKEGALFRIIIKKMQGNIGE